MQISSFKDEDEVIARANNTPYGLAAAVFTNDINRMYKMTSALKAGSVWGNTYNVLVPQVPQAKTHLPLIFPIFLDFQRGSSLSNVYVLAANFNL